MAEYIERETLISELSASCMPIDDREISGLFDCNESIRDIIDAIPAADVRPVVHGHWDIGYFHDRVCSCCLHPDNDLNDYAHDFCPNCGAKMDGKDSESDG